MLKSISNLGTVLNKVNQKSIIGGGDLRIPLCPDGQEIACNQWGCWCKAIDSEIR